MSACGTAPEDLARKIPCPWPRVHILNNKSMGQKGMKLTPTIGFLSFALAINAQDLPREPYTPKTNDPIVLITDVSRDALNRTAPDTTRGEQSVGLRAGAGRCL